MSKEIQNYGRGERGEMREKRGWHGCGPPPLSPPARASARGIERERERKRATIHKERENNCKFRRCASSERFFLARALALSLSLAREGAGKKGKKGAARRKKQEGAARSRGNMAIVRLSACVLARMRV